MIFYFFLFFEPFLFDDNLNLIFFLILNLKLQKRNLHSEERPKDTLQLNDVNADGGEKTPDNPTKGSRQRGSTLRGQSRVESRQENGSRRTSGDRRKDRATGNRREGGAQSPNRGSSSMSGNQRDDQQDGTASIDGSSVEKSSQKLQRFRWILPANSEMSIRLRFTSEEIGQFDQTLNFEIVGTRRRYQLHCRGICTFPTISREPR